MVVVTQERKVGQEVKGGAEKSCPVYPYRVAWEWAIRFLIFRVVEVVVVATVFVGYEASRRPPPPWRPVWERMDKACLTSYPPT